MKISFTWSTRREGNNGYVLEQSSAGHVREYGPMPTRLVLPFVEGRRRICATMAEQAQASYVPDADYSYMNDPKKPIIQN